MKTAEQIMKKKREIKEELDKVLPRDESDALWQEATARLVTYQMRYSSLPRGVRFHTDSRILPCAAIYLTVSGAIGKEKAYKVIEDAAIRKCRPIEAKLQKLMRHPRMRSLFIRLWDPLTRKVFGRGNGFTNVFYPRRKDEYRMDITACPYARYMAELGCPELTRIFCENDERTYGNLPGLAFVRTGTIGKGAACCDFLLRREERGRRV
ncbi:MAG: L-2-amino-thiazoline-4-carboxylic acid hydrolase [Lachnospiraceae bacterium]|nr:L-2-amino-thiazoline-4-carboxylic acid hydrolase [Lachnospiraceae bacterium]MBR0152977.1 L-2-amino-thiazoline-4-carboxylic acid hydrolase [Lachnospiraceae bacterium]